MINILDDEPRDTNGDLFEQTSSDEQDKTYENEGSKDLTPMVQISIKEYDKLKEQTKYITDKDCIAVIEKIGELVRALRKHIRMPL
jgi:hypothetical protein